MGVLGVLTKPDRIPTGEETSWLKFIRNEREELEHGWFCVKQPDSQALKAGITWSEARSRERDFFTGTAPWSGLPADIQRHLSTERLVIRASEVLSDLIALRYSVSLQESSIR